MPDKLLSILSDKPADKDQLGFDPYAKTLTDIITDSETDTPLTIGIFGTWGRGKTSLMQMVRHSLNQTTTSPVRSVWFNAWLYSREDALWRALIARVLEGARRFVQGNDDHIAQLNRLESRLYQATEPANGSLTLPPDLIPGIGDTAFPARTGLELWKRRVQRDNKDAAYVEQIIADVEASYVLTHRARLVALDDFRREFDQLSRECITCNGRLVVFIDDLDRCLPDKAVEVLEAVKLFLDVPGFVFVLGVDRDVIEEGIRIRYAGYETKLDGSLYLEKIIQIPFRLPPIPSDKVLQYIHTTTKGSLPDPRCEQVFSAGLRPNPRRIKRTLNVFLLLWRLSQNREELREVIKPVRLAKIVIIQQYYAALFDLVAQGPHYLIDLEHRFRRAAASEIDAEFAGSRQHHLQVQGGGDLDEDAQLAGEGISAGPLTPFLDMSRLRELLTCTAEDKPDANFIDLSLSGVREYIYLTRSAVEEQPKSQEDMTSPFEPQLVTIPAGPFLMGTPENEVGEILRLFKQVEKKDAKREQIQREVPQREVTLPEYAIARYPVTNAQFARFIEAGGYTTQDYWTDSGWQQKEKESWSQPRYWDDNKWNDPAQPVVGVSWYEAVAYCNWLSVVTERDYRLPTEAQWEKAARGTDGRRYPWEGKWNPTLCNNKENGLLKTTPVGQYHGGDSPYGVGEMVGQVWEWCSSKYGGTAAKPEFGYPYQMDGDREDLEGSDTRILRGGSWYHVAGYCRCGCRIMGYPYSGDNIRGFRCVRILS